MACEAQVGCCELDAVEPARVFDQRRVAPSRDIIDNYGDRGIDIRRGIPPCVE